tara:strand:+ start:351 stop:1061 length:711 start_codon:yes stop_codon:yes gene_type:complete
MSVKDIEIKMLPSTRANNFIRNNHYSGKIVPNSKFHFGIFYNNKLEGVLQYGNPMDKNKTIGLVKNTKWNNFIELNRMALTDNLPKNAESRSIAISIKLLKKYAPHLDWILTYADGTQCGDGTIYRASGFLLTGIKQNKTMLQFPNGEVFADNTFTAHQTTKQKIFGNKNFYEITDGKCSIKYLCEKTGAKILQGFQLRYIKFLKPELQKNLTVDVIPFDEIKKQGASMYKGQSYG